MGGDIRSDGCDEPDFPLDSVKELRVTLGNEHRFWLEHAGRIHISARAIVFNAGSDQLLLEINKDAPHGFWNFPSGGLAVGETLVACIRRELREETGARIRSLRYCFAAENFLHNHQEVRHSIEHYFEAVLEGDRVASKSPGIEYSWFMPHEAGNLDLRPHAVRDAIPGGAFHRISYLLLCDEREGAPADT